MKAFVFALTALISTAGLATAMTSNDSHESAATATPAEPARTVRIPAGDVMTSRELAQAGLRATDLVTITQLSSSSETAGIDNSSRGFF